MQTAKLSTTANKYIDILKSGSIQEQEIISIRSWMGKDKGNAQIVFSNFPDNGLALSGSQNLKGIEFLLGKWKTPMGAERKNNPFGYREQSVLLNFSYFELSGFYNAGNSHHDYYLPLYQCIGKDGAAFEYYYNGEIHIVG